MAYRYTDPVFNAMYGGRTPFQVPGATQQVHIPPRVLARRKPVRVWHPPCPDRTKPTHKEVVLCIRSLQEQDQIPNPYPSVSPAAKDNKSWIEKLDFLPLPGPTAAGAVPLPVCSTGEDCQTQAAQSPKEDELETWNRAHTVPRLPWAPDVRELSDLFTETQVEVTLSPALQKPGARLAGANVLVAWNKLDLESWLKLATLMRAGDQVLVSSLDESNVPVHREAKYEVLPISPQYKPAFKHFINTVDRLYKFVDRLAPGQMNDPDWLKDKRYNDALELVRTVLDKLDTNGWTEETRDMLHQLDQNKWKAVHEVDAAIAATVALQIPLLQQRLGQSLGHRNQWFYGAPELIQKLAPHRMQSQPMAIVAPAEMRLDKIHAGGFMRQLDYVLNEIKPNYRAELSPKLQGRSNVDLAGLVIMVVVDDANDLDERRNRQTLYRRFFDTKRDQLLLFSDPVDGTYCERSRGVPDAQCTYLGALPVGRQIAAGFEEHLPVVTRIAQEMRRSGFTQLPNDDELKSMGAKPAADILKLHLESASAADSPQGQAWLDQLQPDLFHLQSPLFEQFPKKIVEWFGKISKLHKVDCTSFVEARRVIAEGLRDTMLKQLPSVILYSKKAPGAH